MMLPAESNNLPRLPLIVSVSVRTNALKVIISVSLLVYISVPILIYYKMNPRFINDAANIEENRVHISAMPMKTTMSMAIHFMVTYYKSLATMYMKEFDNLILNCFFKVEYCHLYKYTIICVQ